jgi:hypothetical protein
MNFNDIQSLITKAAKSIQDSEKLPVAFLAAKAKKAAEILPYDVPVIAASQVLTSMAANQTFIARDDFSKIIRSYNTNTSKLSTVFADELTTLELSAPKMYQRSNSESRTLEDDYAQVANPVLSNALNAAFSEDKGEAIYSVAEGSKAKKAAAAQITSLGFKPAAMEIFAGRDNIIVCQASYETPKGQSHVLVPVELSDGKVLFPSLFLSMDGFKDLTAENLEEHIVKTAGQKLRVDGDKLLSILLMVRQGGEVPYAPNDVEMAVIKMASNKQVLDPSTSLYTKIEDEVKEVKVEAKDNSFAGKLSQPHGIAEFIHGDKVVEAGRSAVVRGFADMEYKSIQVKVADVSKEKIVFAVSIGNSVGVMVPVTAADVRPKFMVAAGSVLPFTKAAVDKLVKESRGGDRRALATASQSFEMNSQQLLSVVRQAADEGDYKKVEDVMNVLAEKDISTHKIAMAYYIASMSVNPSEEIKSVGNQQAKEPVAMFQSYQMYFPKSQ